MKRLAIILFSIGLTLGASAQKIGGGFKGGIRGTYRPHVTIVAPVAPIYPSYGYYGLGYGYMYNPYNPFYDPFYNRRSYQPTQLDLQIDEIKNEYKFKIDSAKDDKSLSKDQKKQLVRDLKHQRENDIIEAKKEYYKSRDEKKDSDNS